MKKTMLCFALMLSLFTVLSYPSLASSYIKQTLPDGSISLTQTDDSGQIETRVFSEDELVHMTFNGGNVDNQFDVPPFIENNRTLVPIGQLQRLLGASIVWDSTAQTVTIKSNSKINHTVVMQIGSTKATLDGNPITMDVAPQIVMGRTVVPIRFVQVAFQNLDISWESNTKTVDVIQKNY